MGELQCRGLMDSNSFPQAWSTEYRDIMRAPQVVSAAVAVVLLVTVAAAAVLLVAVAVTAALLQVKQRMLSAGLEPVTFRFEA
jgi:hypothetical protein